MHSFNQSMPYMKHPAQVLERSTYLVLRAAQQCPSACIEDRICGGAGRRALLGDLVLEVADLDRVGHTVEHRKAVAGDEDGRGAQAALSLLYCMKRGNSSFRKKQLCKPLGARKLYVTNGA